METRLSSSFYTAELLFFTLLVGGLGLWVCINFVTVRFLSLSVLLGYLTLLRGFIVEPILRLYPTKKEDSHISKTIK